MIRQITQVSDAFFMMNLAKTILDFHLFCSHQKVTLRDYNCSTIKYKMHGGKQEEIKGKRDKRVCAEINKPFYSRRRFFTLLFILRVFSPMFLLSFTFF